MTTSEILTIIFSLTSLCVSVWAAFKASRIGSHEVPLARRMELHAMLNDAYKEQLHDPSLSCMFESSAFARNSYDGPEPPKEKQEYLVLMYLNVFEAAHSVFTETKSLSAAEREVEEAWSRYLVDFLRSCPTAREIWYAYRAQYYDSFRVAVDEKIADIGILTN